MLRQYIAILVLICMLSCADDTPERKDGFSNVASTPEDSLFQAVMDGHDEAMPKSMRIPQYREQLKKRIDSLDKLKSESAIDVRRKYQELDNQLKTAQEGMNKWMKDFQIDSAENDTEQRIKYLTSEKEKVEKVRVDVLAAVAAADSLLRTR
jgi:hypothetical protein